MKPYVVKTSKKNIELFSLIDQLDQLNEDILYQAIRRKSKRLDVIEKSAKELELLAVKIQKQVANMRRK
ncbi:hypothetical protein [Niallia sp. RD1]|uniref:hypothetical protein n=1 Tax=Niallia sp. RD1 TaxID=2962858 RepID=UPI0020C1B8E8|nr:hypothetical protein [Niallia sp. RD1]UTI41071.1 hypothetical protein NKG37_19740 [Niallia sp. RD1]